MSSQNQTESPPPLDVSGWRKLPAALMVIGGLLAVVGALLSWLRRDAHNHYLWEFGFSWLFAFMFYYSIALGALFLVMVHHLSDAGWSVGIRRFCEHLASLLRWPLLVLFLPVAIFGKQIYAWMSIDPATNHSIAAKLPVFTVPGFYVTSAVFFGVWWLLTSRLCSLSLQQDETGAASCTRKMRFHSGWGIVAFALVLTFSAVLWMQGVQHQWFSAMYGVYYFASCAWVGLATVYVIAALLQRQRVLHRLLQPNYFYFLGVLFFGFTLLQAYAEFAQYFVVWNANLPEETFWYLIRERGNWFALSMVLIFGHFFLPFFLLLSVKAKTNFKIIIPVCLWAWVMHAADLAFNIFPALHPDGYHFHWLWLPLGCLMFMGGFLALIFLKKFAAHPPYPQRDPRLLEAMGVRHLPDEMPDTYSASGGAAS